jgi:hypothetical protein
MLPDVPALVQTRRCGWYTTRRAAAGASCRAVPPNARSDGARARTPRLRGRRCAQSGLRAREPPRRDRTTARELAGRNINAFLAAEVDAIIVNSAGCGSTMKEYAELLEHDPEYAEKARHFVALVRDVTEFLVELPFDPRKPPSIEQCTRTSDLVHAQKVRAPRANCCALSGLH